MGLGINTDVIIIAVFFVNVVLPLLYIPVTYVLTVDSCPAPKYVISLLLLLQIVTQLLLILLYLFFNKTKIKDSENLYALEFHDSISSSIYNANKWYKRNVNVSLGFSSAMLILLRLDEFPIDKPYIGVYAVQICSLIMLTLVAVFPGGRHYRTSVKRSESMEVIRRILREIQKMPNGDINDYKKSQKDDTMVKIAIKDNHMERYSKVIDKVHLISAASSLIIITVTNFYFIWNLNGLVIKIILFILNSISLVLSFCFAVFANRSSQYDDLIQKNYDERGRFVLSEKDDLENFRGVVKMSYITELISFLISMLIIVITTFANNKNIPCWIV